MRRTLVLAATFLATAITIAITGAAHAQPMPADAPDTPVDAATRTKVIAAALAAIDRGYVFPETAAKANADVKRREAAGEYAKLDMSRAFAQKLTADLQETTKDKHLRVLYRAPGGAPPGGPGAPGSTAAPAPRPMPLGPGPDNDRFLKSVNYGFEKAERLEGNVGLLELRTFTGEGPQAEAATAAAMSFLANTDALIIDLRRNGGGRPEMVALLSSYLFDARTHLNDLYWREGNRTDEFWTTDNVVGTRYGSRKPVFVLTSKRTFSGAEEFAYNLKALKRATIVGETSGGGAHPGGVRPLGDGFAIFVPTGRAINPVTKTNWEGTGVAPDVEVPADQALEKAKELARAAMAKA